MDDLDIDSLTDSELRAILELPPGRDGLRHYMAKKDKIAYIRSEDDPELREQILDRARAAQQQHHRYLVDRRRVGGKPDRAKLVEARMANATWRYLRRMKSKNSFRDEVTGRKAKVIYIIENVATGATMRVTKATIEDAYERLGNVLSWPPVRARGKIAEESGTPTGLSLPSRNKGLYRR